MTRTVEVETNTGPKGQGLLSRVGRSLLGGESFFQNVYRASAPGAHVTLAPRLCGSMLVHQVQPGQDLLIQGSSYVAAPDSVVIDTQFQGFKGFFSGETLFFLKAGGQGPVLINAFGALETIDLNGEMVVDTGHIVAFTSGIAYSIDKAAAGWIASFLSGEGLVLRLRGHGRLYIQSRNPKEFAASVGKRLPPRES